MAKNFGNAGSVKKFKEVAKASNEKANVIQVKMISNENLKDYPRNNEDVTDTIDLENSMKELGFTDPLEVTSFGMNEGQYMIVSGHRRRRAGLKVGIDTFPCIIKSFLDENELYNYVLLANSQRDTAKDPLLFCKRYKMHEEYLNESGFTGRKREEIAKRLGISVQQADRYKKFNDVILSVWGMVTEGIVGMSSVLPMATHNVQEQNEIYNLLKEHYENGNTLSREVCNKIIKAYREGKKSLYDIFKDEKAEKQIQLNENEIENEISIEKNDKVDNKVNDTPILGHIINTDVNEEKEKSVNGLERNNEINYDFSHREGLESDKYKDERLNDDDKKVIELADKQKEKQKDKQELSDTDKEMQAGEKLINSLAKLENILSDKYSFEDEKKAENVLSNMATIVKMIFCEIEDISSKYKIDEKYKDVMEDIKNELLNEYKI